MCGTVYTYKMGCRCQACGDAMRTYQRNNRAGVELTVEAEVPREVVRQLHDDAHLSFRAIGTACGMKGESMRELYQGKRTHVRIVTADALYALQAEVELAHPNLAAKWSLDAELAER